MKIIIISEYLFNLIVLSIFYMHIFQLNSYFANKHIKWCKTNIKKIILQSSFILITGLLQIFNNIFLNIESAILLLVLIIYNFPKKKSKVKFVITNRVKRMFISEFLIILMALFSFGIENFIYIKLIILNILSPFICIIVNFINSPIENARKKHYIKEAKEIINSMPNLIVIGVTGSYGKTSVKNFLQKMLSNKYQVLVTEKNYNTTMGVVKTIRNNLKPIHQVFICEMGATKNGDIKEICDIVKPKIGIITSIGPQHLESFKTIENIIDTKFELAEAVKENNGKIFLNYDNEFLKNNSKCYAENIIYYGVENKNLNYNAYDLSSTSNGLLFKIKDIKGCNKEINFETKIIGKHNIINLTGAMAISNYLGINLEKLIPTVRNIKNVEHRLQLITKNDLTIIDDSYNSNPISSKAALDTLNEFNAIKIIITPGLIELGDFEYKYNFEFGKYIEKICDYIFLVKSKQIQAILDGISSNDKNKIIIVDTVQEAISKISKLVTNTEKVILIENDLPDNYNL